MDALARKYAGLRHEFRLESLGERLRHHPPLAIRDNTCGFAGDRWRIELDDGTTLRLKLYWPHRVRVAALCSVSWCEGEGWRLIVTTTDGTSLLLHAFSATLTQPADHVTDR